MDPSIKIGSISNRVISGLIFIFVILYFVGGALMGENFIGFALLSVFIFPVIVVVYIVSIFINFKHFNRLDKVVFGTTSLLIIYIFYLSGLFCSFNVCPWLRDKTEPQNMKELQETIYSKHPELDPSSPQYRKDPVQR